MKVSKYKIKIINNRRIYIASSKQKNLDNDMYRELKKKYSLKDHNREYIINALLTVITQNNDYQINKSINLTVLRMDIKSFYESVNTHKIYRKINKSMILSDPTLKKIKEIVFSGNVKGLPQGVSLSAGLSEIYLEDFDKNIPIILPNVLLYERFVDDIIIL